MRNKYDEDLQNLHNSLIKMGGLCEHAISLAMSCFEEDSDVSVDTVRLTEVKIDEYEREIERQCMRLLLQQQPVAGDLRNISAALKMITDLERIGDQAVDIADLSRYTTELNSHILSMAKTSIEMLSAAIDSFVGSNLELAQDTIEKDDIVDGLFLDVRRDIIEVLRSNNDNAENMLDMLMIAKYLERIADHAVNVSEWVIYSITGKHKGEDYDSDTRRR